MLFLIRVNGGASAVQRHSREQLFQGFLIVINVPGTRQNEVHVDAHHGRRRASVADKNM